MTRKRSFNHIQQILDSHAAEGFTAIRAQAANMEKIYFTAKEKIIAILRAQADSGKDPLAGKYYAALLESLSKTSSALDGNMRKAAKLGINQVSGLYYDKCLKLLKSQGYGIMSKKISKTYVNGMVDDAWNHIAGATKKMEAEHIKMLRELSARSFREAALTGETRKQISQRLFGEAVNKFNGQFQFIAKNGARWQSDVYFEMLSTTVLHNASRSAYLNACAKNNADIVRVSISGNPCPACAQFENRLLSISGTAPGIPSLQSAITAGLFHPNCTHTITVVPASMQRKYFSSDGRPESGLNSPGNIKKDDPEAWKKYRAENKKQKKAASIKSSGSPKTVAAGKAPVSAAIDYDDGLLAPSAKRAMDAIDSVHGDGKLPKIPLKYEMLKPGLKGKFAYYRGNDPIGITLSSIGETPELTAVHESGHFLDMYALGNWGQSAFKTGFADELNKAIKGTKAFKRQAALLSGSRTSKYIDMKHIRYLNKDEELFARAYAQYIASASGDKVLLKQLNGIVASKYNRVYNSQWSRTDFKKVSKAFDSLFKEKGWIQ